jgi:hypothetical protein
LFSLAAGLACSREIEGDIRTVLANDHPQNVGHLPAWQAFKGALQKLENFFFQSKNAFTQFIF